MDFLEIFEQKIYNQYLVIAIAVLIVVAIKIWMTNKAYKNKLASFVHPDTVLQDLKKKIKSVDDAQSLLAINFLKVGEEGFRLRNIAFLMTYLKNQGIPLKPLQKKITDTFSNLKNDKLSKSQKAYRQYIQNEVEKQKNQNTKVKGKKMIK